MVNVLQLWKVCQALDVTYFFWRLTEMDATPRKKNSFPEELIQKTTLAFRQSMGALEPFAIKHGSAPSTLPGWVKYVGFFIVHLSKHE